MSLPTSPYCTIGPFFPGEFAKGCGDLTNFNGKQARGRHILFTGRVFEEGKRPIQNATLQFNYKGTPSGEEMKIEIVRSDGQGAPMSCTAKHVK